MTSTLGTLIIEKYVRFSFMQTPCRTIEQIATHFIRTLRHERQASSQVRALASKAGVGPTCRSTRTPEMPVHFVVAGSRAPFSWTLGALIIEKYGRFHSCKCHAAQSNKLPPISFALCVMKGRRHRGCGRWRPRLALAQHVAQPGRPSMPVHFVVAG